MRADPGTAPGGGLVVSGGGRVAVSTEELASLERHLRSIQDASEDAIHRLKSLSGRADAVPASAALNRAADSAALLGLALRLSADAYGNTERMLQLAGAESAAGLGFALGRLAPVIALAAFPRLLGIAVGVAVGTRVFPGIAGQVADWIAGNPRLISNPLTVAAVRLMVSAGDDTLAGLFGMPPAVARSLGDSGLGVFGLPQTTALLLAGLGGITAVAKTRHLRETTVTVRPTGSAGEPVTAPTGVGALIDRIPGSAEGDPQIRLERYPEGPDAGSAEGSRWILYLGGTIDLGVLPGTEPFDMTSNLHATAGADAGSLRATVAALELAGVQPGEPVLAVGYSQGGLLAAQIERSGDFNVQGVLTVGAPIGQLALDAPTAAIAHTEDLVPALGGLETETGDDRILVRRSAFSGREMPVDHVLPAHALTEYRATAAMIDASLEPRIKRYRESIAGFLSPGVARGAVRLYRADRIP
jgi:hypothetical protein